MKENKKIINAKSVESEGITFRSKTERTIFQKLVSLGYSPEYEPDTFTIWNGFEPTKPWYEEGNPHVTKKKDPVTGKFTVPTNKVPVIEDWRYTPDIKLKKGNCTFYIEVKGFPNDLWPYKRKIFLRKLEEYPNTYFFEVKTIGGLLRSLAVMEQIYETSGQN